MFVSLLQFELVCENSVFVSTYQVVGTVGALLGAQLVGVFADRQVTCVKFAFSFIVTFSAIYSACI